MPTTKPSGVGTHTESHVASRPARGTRASRAPRSLSSSSSPNRYALSPMHEAALAEVLDGPLAVVVVVLLVGVDEHGVERARCRQRRQHVATRADEHGDPVGEPGRRDVRARDLARASARTRPTTGGRRPAARAPCGSPSSRRACRPRRPSSRRRASAAARAGWPSLGPTWIAGMPSGTANACASAGVVRRVHVVDVVQISAVV